MATISRPTSESQERSKAHPTRPYRTKATISLLSAILFLIAAPPSRADFIGEKGHTLTHSGDWWYNSFTVSGSTQTFVLYFTSQYNATALVAPTSQLSSFTSGGSVSYIDGFQNNFGYKSITLQPGSYFVGVRSNVGGDNRFSVELEDHPPEESGATYAQAGIKAAEYVTAGGTLTHDFTIQSGFRYIIEGCNSGDLNTYIIPRSEKSKFESNQTFQYYSDYGGVGDANEPGLQTINLNPGNYTLAVRSTSGISEAITYVMYIYRVDTWSQYYQQADSDFGDYAAAGDINFAWAFYYFNKALGDYDFHSAYGRKAEATYWFHIWIGAYHYYYFQIIPGAEGAAAAAFELRKWYAYAYYYYHSTRNEPDLADFWFNYWFSQALAFL